MGFSISWIAVRYKTPDTLLEELSLKRTGEMSEYPEAPICGRTLPGGWFMLVFDEINHPLVTTKSFAAISKDCDAVICSIEEHVMVATSELWRNGEQIWRIEHDAQQSIDHIEASGNLPSEYAAIVEEYATQQENAGGKKADTDYFFEIPLQIAKNIVGFKHDESDFQDEGFEEFQDVAVSPKIRPTAAVEKTPHHDVPKHKPWWKVW